MNFTWFFFFPHSSWRIWVISFWLICSLFFIICGIGWWSLATSLWSFATVSRLLAVNGHPATLWIMFKDLISLSESFKSFRNKVELSSHKHVLGIFLCLSKCIPEFKTDLGVCLCCSMTKKKTILCTWWLWMNSLCYNFLFTNPW